MALSMTRAEYDELVERETVTGLRTCSKCGVEKQLSAFNQHAIHRVERATRCRVCENARKRLHEQEGNDPESLSAVNRAVDAAPDPQPAVQLRLQLERLRASGRPWPSAWRQAVATVVRTLPPAEATAWRRVFSSTRGAWQGAYTGIPWPVVERSAVFLPDEPEVRERIAA